MAKARITIPPDIAAKVLFQSNRTCCVCRQEGKKVQIHHIDENPANNKEENLAILCFECHTETMIKGGFHRKLDAEQIILYRNDWHNIIARNRNSTESKKENSSENNASRLELATSIAEIYRENEEYELLAMHYHNIDNFDLRDKYIEKVLSNNPSDDSYIFLKGLQNKGEEVPKEIVERHVKRHEAVKDWLEIGRIYKNIQDPTNSTKYYLKGISEVLKKRNYFTTAFYLKELVEEGLIEELFRLAYLEAKNENDLWWQVRALQELEWYTELEELLKENKKVIEESNDLRLLQLLAEVENKEAEFIALRKREAEGTHLYPDGSVGIKTVDDDSEK